MATCFGWSWEYIDEFVTIPRLHEIMAYQKDNPPTHVLVKGLLSTNRKGSTAIPQRSDPAPAKADAEPANMSGFFSDLAAMGVDLTPLMDP